MILRISLALSLIPGSLSLAQTTATQAATMSINPPARTGATLPSATLQPSLDMLKTALAGTRVDRWKASAAIRGEAEANLRSINNDLSSTLPGLLSAADAAPSSPAKVLPAYRNADALYSVLLRIVTSASLAAPADQSSALGQALTSLGDSRRALGDQLQLTAQAQETLIARLQAALKAVPPPAPPAPAAAPAKCPTTPARRKTTTKKTAQPAAK